MKPRQVTPPRGLDIDEPVALPESGEGMCDGNGAVASTYSVVAATGGLATWIWWLLVTDRL